MAQHIAICVAVFNSDYKSAYIFDILFVISTKKIKIYRGNGIYVEISNFISPRDPEINIFIRGYAARYNISFRDNSVTSSSC